MESANESLINHGCCFWFSQDNNRQRAALSFIVIRNQIHWPVLFSHSNTLSHGTEAVWTVYSNVGTSHPDLIKILNMISSSHKYCVSQCSPNMSLYTCTFYIRNFEHGRLQWLVSVGSFQKPLRGTGFSEPMIQSCTVYKNLKKTCWISGTLLLTTSL